MSQWFPRLVSHTQTPKKAAIDAFFARRDDDRPEILSLITDEFHFMDKLNPQEP